MRSPNRPKLEIFRRHPDTAPNMHESIVFGEGEQREKRTVQNFTDRNRQAHVSLAMEKGTHRESGELGQDAALYNPETGLMAVADGAGGSKDGAHASRFAVEHANTIFETLPAPEVNPEAIRALAASQIAEHFYNKDNVDTEKLVAALVQEYTKLPRPVLEMMLRMHKTYTRLQSEVASDSSFVGATTLLLAVVAEVEQKRYVVHLSSGDSTIEKIRVDGTKRTLSKPQNMERYLGGNLPPMMSNQLVGRLASTPSEVPPAISVDLLREGEAVVLKTDGLTKNRVAEEKSGSVVMDAGNAAEELIDNALDNDPDGDDKAAIVYQWQAYKLAA